MKTILHTVVAMAVFVLLTGCRTATPKMAKGPLTPDEIKSVQAGKKTIVLFRLTNIEDGTQETTDYLDRVRWNIWNVGDWKKFHRVAGPSAKSTPYWRLPAEISRQTGWRYLVLEPGRYFVEARPADDKAHPFPVYHLSVPEGAKVVYAGSFPFTFTNEANLPTRFISAGVRDETAAARDIMKSLQPSLGDVTPCLAVPNDLAAVLPPRSHPTIAMTGTINYPPHRTRYVGRKAGAIAAGPFIIAGVALIALEENSHDNNTIYQTPTEEENAAFGDLMIVFGGLTLMMTSVPMAVVGDATAGSIIRQTWKPHEAELERELARFDLAGQLTNSVLQQLATNGPAAFNSTNTGPTLVLRVGAYRMGLEPTDILGWNYWMDTAAYLAVIDPASNQVIWEHGYVFGHEKHEKGINPFTTFIAYGGDTLSLGDYKGKEGLHRVDIQLDDAVSQISKKMAADLRAAGF